MSSPQPPQVHTGSPQPPRARSSPHSIHDKRSATSQTENVSVCVRVKPIPTGPLFDIDLDTPTPQHRHHSRKENRNRFGSWIINPAQSTISLSPSHPIIDRRGTGTSEAINGSEGYEFQLDQVFDPYSTTADLYRSSLRSLVESCVKDAYNVTVFAYGQTGSGKTFTMMGSKDDGEDETLGIIPRAVADVFDVIASDSEREYLLRVSYLEIYNEALKDLLAADQSLGPTNRLAIHENNKGRVHVNGIREEVVTHPMQVLGVLTRGEKARHVGATDWNERSSRSHTVFTMTIESRPKPSGSAVDITPTQISQLNLIDLAGSESAASSTERRKEGSFINKSLLALSNVISKLSKNEAHIPYRDSKLTRLLQTSLKGNAKVLVICTVSAEARSVVETLSTLRFARRAKMVVTKAERGTILDDKSALLQAYQREIMSLKAQLQQNSQALSISTTSAPALAEINAEKSKAESEVTALRFERIRLQEQIEHLNRRILTSQTIEANVRRANSVQSSTSPSRRRIVSGQSLRPRKSKARITDAGVGGMVGMLGIGLSASGYLSNTPLSSEESRAHFQRELELEKELLNVRHQLVKLTQEKSESSNESASCGLDLLKDQIRALEGDKENLPMGIAQEDEQGRRIQALEDELETMRLDRQQLDHSHATEIESLKAVLSSLEASKEIALRELQEQLAATLVKQDDKLKLALNEAEESHRVKLALLQEQVSTCRTHPAQADQAENSASCVDGDPHDATALKPCQIQKLQNDSQADEVTSSTPLNGNVSIISTLEAELRLVKQEREEAVWHLQETRNMIPRLETELNALRQDQAEANSAHQEQIDELLNEKSAAATKLVELQSRFEAELAVVKKENEDLLSTKQQQVVKLEAEKAHSDQTIQDLRSRLEAESITSRADKVHLGLVQEQLQEHQDQLLQLRNSELNALEKIQQLESQLKADSNLEEALDSTFGDHHVSAQSANEKHEGELLVKTEEVVILELQRSSAHDEFEETNSDTAPESNSCLPSDTKAPLPSEQSTELEPERSDAQMDWDPSMTALWTELRSLQKEKEDQLAVRQLLISKLQTVLLEASVKLQQKQVEESQSEAAEAHTSIQDLPATLDQEIESWQLGKDESTCLPTQESEKVDSEQSTPLATVVQSMTAAEGLTNDPGLDECVNDVRRQLSGAIQQIASLSSSNVEKQKVIEALQSRIGTLEVELSQAESKGEELSAEKSRAEENLKMIEADLRAQLKALEVKIFELETALEAEQTARSKIEDSSQSLLDAARLKAMLDNVERRLAAERNKSQEKELELMKLIQERDQALRQIDTLQMALGEISGEREDDKSIMLECEAKVQQAEKSAAEAQSGLEAAKRTKGVLEQKLESFECEVERLKAELQKIECERANQELHQGKLEEASAKLKDDLTEMQKKEKAMMDKIESIVQERCDLTTSRLQDIYNSKLTRLEQSNSNLEAHIKSLESHLVAGASEQRHQTTAESMETIVDLQGTIDDQNREIKNLRAELEHVKKSLVNRPLQSIHNKPSDHDHYHQSTEDELGRLYHIIDEQEKRLSDAKTDLSKWQARVRNQTEIISKLKVSSESDSDPKPKLFLYTPHDKSRQGFDGIMTSSSPVMNNTLHGLNRQSPAKLTGPSPLLGGAPRSPMTWQSNTHLLQGSSSSPLQISNNCPRPLPVPESFLSAIDDDEAQRRKNRRRTIEKDMAKLKDENVVEKKLNSLLSSSTFNPKGSKANPDNSTKVKVPSSPLTSGGINRFEVPSSSILPIKPTHTIPNSYSAGPKPYHHHRQSSSSSPFSTASHFSSSSQRGYYE